MSEAAESVEISNPIAGTLKVSGASVNNIFTIFGFLLLLAILWVVWTNYNNAIASDRAMAEAFARNNEMIIGALKTTTDNSNKALERLADAQDRTARAQDKTNCLLAIPPDARSRADELCTRILRRQ